MSGSQSSLVSQYSLRLLSDDAIKILKTRGPDSVLRDGFRHVSNASYISDGSYDSEATVKIPEYLDSVETLEFLEFRREVAEMIFLNFQKAYEEHPSMSDFLGFICRYIRNYRNNAIGERDDWEHCLRSMGFIPSFPNRLLDLAFISIRFSRSAKEWAIMMIEMRYQFLSALDRVVKDLPQDRPPPPSPQHYTITGYVEKGKEKAEKGKEKAAALPLAGIQIPIRSSSKGKGGKPPKTSDPRAGPSTMTKAAPPPKEMEGCKIFY
ncbi:hypothetical protein MMC14_004306 [Varicellaria rhodocarpa]|nr:hypothetical protein [Varicellaria rhodocarpa]